MATAVLQREIDTLSHDIAGLDRYDRAMILVRRGPVPMAIVEVPVSDGRIDGDAFRAAVVLEVADRLATAEALEAAGLPVIAPRDCSSATVAVCTRDRPDDLDRCLTALRALDATGHALLVIDNASAGDATRQAAERHDGVRYVREDRPGLDIARNRALREARTPIVAFCDDDAAPDRYWLRALMRNFADPRTLCVTGLTLPLELETEAQEWFERTNAFGRGLERIRYDGAADDPFLVGRVGAGANMALRVSVLDIVGPFDEALDAGTPAKSGGDHDMFVRILQAGHCIVYEPGAISHHRHRRDWKSLQDTVRGYGTGVYAHLSKHLVEGGETRALGIALGWGAGQVRGLLRSLGRRPGATPLDLVLAELRGCLAGPRAWRTARRRLRAMPPSGTASSAPRQADA